MSISQFLTTATGPSKFYSDLKLRTKSVRTLLNTFETVSTVSSEVPVSVLGKELYALMSDRLQQQLLSLEESDEIVETVPDNRVRLTTDSDINFGSPSKDLASLPWEKESKRQFTSQEPDLQRRKQVFPLPSPHQVVKESTSPTVQHNSIVRKSEAVPPIQFPNKIMVEPDLWAGLGEGKVIQSEKKTEIAIGTDDRSSFADPGNHLPKVNNRKSGIESLLVKKLDDYWQLSQQERAEQPRSSNLINEDKEHPSKASPSLSSPLQSLSPPSWSDMIGQEVAQKVRSIASGQSASSSAQTMPTNLPEKVEIQNVFNIEVNPPLDREAGSMTKLSEKIADILHEQAVQQGIDIT